MRWIRVALALSLMTVASAHAADPEKDGGESYAREQLVREAHRIVQPSVLELSDLGALKSALAEDFKLRANWKPATDQDRKLLASWDGTIAARQLLLGKLASTDASGEPIPAADGALQQARGLLRWLLADTPEDRHCGVVLFDARIGKDGKDWSFTYPVLPPNGAPTAPAPAIDTSLPKAGESDKPAPQDPSPTTKDTPSSAPPARAPAPTFEEWARAVRVAEEGTLRGKEIMPAVCDDVAVLLEAAATPTPIQDLTEAGLTLKRHALEAADPLTYNAALVAVSRLQAIEWVEVLREDRPSNGLIDDGAVREKLQQASQFETQLKALEAQRVDLLARLDAMVLALDGWKTMAAVLAVGIEDRKAELNRTATDTTSPPSAPDLSLRVLSAQETVVGLEMRLLYLAVARTEVRLGLLSDSSRPTGLLEILIQSARDELAAAQASRALYEEELARVRRDRRLDRLQSEARRIRARRDALGDAAALTGTPKLRTQAYAALLNVNTIVQQAVRLRRQLGDWSSSQPSGKATRETSADDPIAFARGPEKAVWDTTTLARWGELLERPEFDTTLVAEHFAESEVRHARLRSMLRTTDDASALRAAFVEAVAKAEAAMAPLAASRDWATRTDRLPELLASWRRDFEDSFDGRQHEEELIAKRQTAIEVYQQQLLDLDGRSLRIRMNSGLNGPDLAAATQDGIDGLTTAGRWVAMDDPKVNVFRFVADHWLGLLVLILAVIAACMGTRSGRKFLDRWLADRAQRHPQIQWVGASVSRERQDAKARNEQDAAAAAARTAELLRGIEAESRPPAPPGSEPGGVTSNAAPAESPLPKRSDTSDKPGSDQAS